MLGPVQVLQHVSELTVEWRQELEFRMIQYESCRIYDNPYYILGNQLTYLSEIFYCGNHGYAYFSEGPSFELITFAINLVCRFLNGLVRFDEECQNER